MKIIDKLIIIGLGITIIILLGFENVVSLIGIIPIIYSVIYLVLRGLDE